MQNERSDDLLAVALFYYVRDDKYSPIRKTIYCQRLPSYSKKQSKYTNAPLDYCSSTLLTIHQPSPPTAATFNH